jgi:hypothetical protein
MAPAARSDNAVINIYRSSVLSVALWVFFYLLFSFFPFFPFSLLFLFFSFLLFIFFFFFVFLSLILLYQRLGDAMSIAIRVGP